MAFTTSARDYNVGKNVQISVARQDATRGRRHGFNYLAGNPGGDSNRLHPMELSSYADPPIPQTDNSIEPPLMTLTADSLERAEF